MPRITKDEANKLYREQQAYIYEQFKPKVNELSRQAHDIYEQYAQKYWNNPADKLTLAGYGLVDNVEGLNIRIYNPRDRMWNNCIFINFPDGLLTTLPQNGNGSRKHREYCSGGGTEHNIPAMEPIIEQLAAIKAEVTKADRDAYDLIHSRPTLVALIKTYPNLNPKQ